MSKTKEPQYQRCLEVEQKEGLAQLGYMSNQTWYDDPKRLVFVLSRYKFVSKMLSGKKKVLEVGCADAFGTRIVLQEVESLCAVDFDPLFIEDVKNRMSAKWSFEARVHDMLEGPVSGDFDGAYALDVLEHINPEDEDRFVTNICDSVTERGVVIFGIPSLESQAYASPGSVAGHVNCKTGAELKKLGERYFYNSFVFCMNDEVVHTGFFPMANYLFLLGVGKKR
ncbi:MAG: class I SAM-dependent methyltransferase [Candidatus Dadabacteria bacterium]|nr:MAG: class I SAM-dependent methyltransferase [Candidatus Dadabacteria bacterium]